MMHLNAKSYKLLRQEEEGIRWRNDRFHRMGLKSGDRTAKTGKLGWLDRRERGDEERRFECGDGGGRGRRESPTWSDAQASRPTMEDQVPSNAPKCPSMEHFKSALHQLRSLEATNRDF